MNESLIQFKDVSFFYEQNKALININCRIHAGEAVFLTGHSGAGKSSFLKLLALQAQPCEGEVLINGVDLDTLSDDGKALYRRKIGMVHQYPRFIDDFTIAENVALPLRLRGYSYPEAQKRVRAALYKVGLLDRSLDYFSMLSGGERQRAEIARAIVHRPMILLADEPTGNLDSGLSHEIMDLLMSFQEMGSTLIIVSHDQPLMQRYPIRTLELKKGMLLQHLPTLALTQEIL